VSSPARLVVRHLPLLAAAAIVVVGSADIPAFQALKTESSYGLWVVVLIPAAVLLFLAQVAVWVWSLRRGRGTPGRGRGGAAGRSEGGGSPPSP
jgi:hypothetical protein